MIAKKDCVLIMGQLSSSNYGPHFTDEATEV